MQISRNKLLKYMIICISLVTIFTCDKISAKNVAMECEYNFVRDSLAGFGGGKVKCTIYIDNSHKCILDPDGVKNEKYVSNWGTKVADFDAKSYYKKNRTCPAVMVYYNDPNLPDQIFFADNTTTANNIKNKQDNPSKCYLSADTTDESLKKKYAEKISNHTIYIKKTANDYNFDKCIEEEKTITRVQKCSDIIEGLTMYINSAETEVNSWISAGYVNSSDNVAKEFKTAVEDARKIIKKANKEIDNEREKIKSELGLENDYKEENTSSGDMGEKTSGCGIFGEKTLALVKRVYKFIQFLIPVLVIVFGMLDFIKALGSGEEKEFKKAGRNFAKRIIIGVCFFLIPAILSLFIRISGITSQYDINDGVKSIFCILE